MRELPKGLSQSGQLQADTGYFSKGNVERCRQAGIEPLIAVERDAHHPGWRTRFEEPEAFALPVTPLEQMTHTLKTQAGRAIYGVRKRTVSLCLAS